MLQEACPGSSPPSPLCLARLSTGLAPAQEGLQEVQEVRKYFNQNLHLLLPPSSGSAVGGDDGGSFGGLGAASDEDYSFDDGFGGESEGSLEETIPGIPGDDYPIFAEVPDTSFVCDGLVEGGYYADVEAECQVFHICGNDGNGGLTKYSFLCPNGE